VSPLPSTSRPSCLPSVVDVTKAKQKVSGHHEWGTPGVSDCEHPYAERATERLLRVVNFIALLSKALPVRVEVSGSRLSGPF